MGGQILIVSGPSGSGKSTLIERLMKEENNIYFSISSTTRKIRAGEKDDVNYHYISVSDFEKGIKEGEFLEYAVVHKNYYGTSIKPVLAALEAGKSVIFDIDVQGFDIVRKKFDEEITSVFITTKTKNELEKRLKKRGSNDEKDIERRLYNAAIEMQHIKDYDYFLINDDLANSYRAFKAIFRSMKFKTKNLNVAQIAENWID
ncbi:guanylate kinase [Campylobacter hominis]|uniref:Guanylate kinase n=1 Tax=Campylobacter hominis (strain ATCC BAA-381 / DSM 21671 / CCUG 45161 / LMG 19568 / NCTC 13146 / CH001A) TaxID=360107 RepID=A7I2R1_CAMHC|nr:guanylate kinase [Campylobacter hominis]ABS51936.1 guanylate kinase [Campylobacter hominis ATCC BAA-381]UAK85950.1 guanylate kinase [Campylobacter hominis]SUW85322.1 guanylate kinase [Campylobacter hominis]